MLLLDIYTDARSGIVRTIQIGSVIIDQFDNEYRFSEKISIGSIKHKLMPNKQIYFRANSTIAELQSIYRSLENLLPIKEKIKNINIYTDSNSSFEMINSISNPKHILIKLMICQIKDVVNQFSSVDVMWVKGHSGCWGNEIAHELCRPKSKNINEKII